MVLLTCSNQQQEQQQEEQEEEEQEEEEPWWWKLLDSTHACEGAEAGCDNFAQGLRLERELRASARRFLWGGLRRKLLLRFPSVIVRRARPFSSSSVDSAAVDSDCDANTPFPSVATSVRILCILCGGETLGEPMKHRFFELFSVCVWPPLVRHFKAEKQFESRWRGTGTVEL